MLSRGIISGGLFLAAIALIPIPLAAADKVQSVRTQSGKVRCEVFANDIGHGGGPVVVCQQTGAAPFPQAPMSAQYGTQMNLAVVRPNGALTWDIGNIPGSDQALASDIVLDYGQTYHINGWTILPTFDGTRFTSDATGHGMFVSIDNVYSY